MTQEKMIEAQKIIEQAMSFADDESQDYIRQLVLKACADLELPIRAYEFIYSWAIGKYC